MFVVSQGTNLTYKSNEIELGSPSYHGLEGHIMLYLTHTIIQFSQNIFNSRQDKTVFTYYRGKWNLKAKMRPKVLAITY